MSKKLILLFLSLVMICWQPVWAHLPYHPIEFPRDDAAHFENVPYPVKTMTEWWYYNGKMTSTQGREFGYYVTFAYIKLDMSGKAVLIPRLEIQITDVKNQKVYGNAVFYPIRNFYASTQNLYVAMNKNTVLQKLANTYVGEGVVKSKQGPELEFSLQWTPTRDALLASGTGIIDMSETTNSYYYSHTHLITKGYIKIGNEKFEIDPERSLTWMDHQWGDFIITPKNPWVWASVQLENGIELDLAMSMAKGGMPAKKFVNIVMPDDKRLYLTDFDYIVHAVEPGHKHPLRYDLKIPAINLNLKLTAVAPGQDVNGVWEGLSDAVGTYQGAVIKGQANTESTVHY